MTLSEFEAAVAARAVPVDRLERKEVCEDGLRQGGAGRGDGRVRSRQRTRVGQ